MSVADLKIRISANADQLDSAMKKMQRSFNKSVRKMERTGKNLTKKVTVPIGLMAAAAGKASIDFESAFAGVRKTVDATEAEFAGLRKGILDMSKELPTSANEIAGVAEAAGQLDVQAQNVLSFSRTMVMMGDTTDMAANTAAKAMARIDNIMQLGQKSFSNMGSTVVDLGNNFATTESEITEMSTRLAPAGKIANMAASNIFAISAALSSVGVRAESGGTAAQKGILAINDAVVKGNEDLKVFAETAGMTSKQFQTAWREDSGKAFTAFINGLGESGDKATSILDDVGLSSERTRTAFLSLSGAGDLLNRAMETGAEAWKENTALTEEAEERYKTIASRIQTLRNRFFALGVSIGDALMPSIEGSIGFIENLTMAFEELSAKAKSRILLIAGLLAVGGPLILALTKVIKVVKTLALVATSKFTLIAAAVGLAIAIGKNLIDNWGVIQVELESIWDGIKFAAWALADAVTKAIVRMADGVLAGLQAIAQAVKPTMVPAIAAARHAMDSISDSVGSNLEKAGKAFDDSTDRAEAARDNIVDLGESFNSLVTGIGSFIGESTGLTSLLGMWENKFNDVGDAVGKAEENLMSYDAYIAKRNEKLGGGIGKSEFGVPTIPEIKPPDPKPFNDGLDDMKEKAVEVGDALQSTITSAVTSFGETLGNVFTGDAGASSFFDGLLIVVNDFANQFGKLLVGAGVAALAFQKLLLNPIAAIAAGTALIAATTAVKNLLEKGPQSRDIGGPVSAGSPYLIGKGPHQELFVPERSGSIMSPSRLRTSGGGGGRAQVIENVLVMDGEIVYRNQKEVAYKRGR